MRADSPGTTFGSASTVQVDGSPVKHALLTFHVAGTAGRTVTSAKLRLRCTDASSAGGVVHRILAPGAWSEATVTWATAPAYDPVAAASLGAVVASTWYEVDVTALVVGDGLVGLRLVSSSSNGADYSSKEGSLAPLLVVTLS